VVKIIWAFFYQNFYLGSFTVVKILEGTLNFTLYILPYHGCGCGIIAKSSDLIGVNTSPAIKSCPRHEKGGVVGVELFNDKSSCSTC